MPHTILDRILDREGRTQTVIGGIEHVLPLDNIISVPRHPQCDCWIVVI